MTEREFLLRLGARFTESAREVRGIDRIALIGSLTRKKYAPKDADVLVTIRADVDMESLAIHGRKLKGAAQTRNLGADIFLCDAWYHYVGRICSWRECHPRVACGGTRCGYGNRICDDLHNVDLNPSLLKEPPLEIWPRILVRGTIPDDTRHVLVQDV
jgi:hypothetical protein